VIQVCLNGSRARGPHPPEHPAVPYTPAELAADASACVTAGANSVHAHVRDASGAESLEPADVAAAVEAIRAAAPDTELSLSTGLWITGGDVRRRADEIGGWTVRPDVVSLNVAEPGWRPLAASLRAQGIGIEIGLASVADAREFVSDPVAGVVRALIEVEPQDPDAAVAEAAAMEAAFEEAGFDVPRLHHGSGPATWAVIDAALALGRDVRIGLEDVLAGPDGEPVDGNAALVRRLAG
jgi:uncharacterized protein (DUF849 family)